MSEAASAEPARLLQSKRTAFGGPFALEQVTGIEPAYSAWEADTLPLSYTCLGALQL